MTTYIIMKPSSIATTALAGVILSILFLGLSGSVFKEFAIRCPPKCSQGDISGIADFVQIAKVTTHGMMGEVCLSDGAAITSAEIMNGTEDVDTIRFVCNGKVCSGAAPKLEVDEARIVSKGNPVFDIRAACMQNVGANICTLLIEDNKGWS